jgi:hypothetical protein
MLCRRKKQYGRKTEEEQLEYKDMSRGIAAR